MHVEVKHTEKMPKEHKLKLHLPYGASRKFEKHSIELERALSEIRREPVKTYKIRDQPASVESDPLWKEAAKNNVLSRMLRNDRAIGSRIVRNGPHGRGTTTSIVNKYNTYELVEFDHPPQYHFNVPSNKGEYKRDRYLRRQLEESVQQANRRNRFFKKLDDERAEYEARQKQNKSIFDNEYDY